MDKAKRQDHSEKLPCKQHVLKHGPSVKHSTATHYKHTVLYNDVPRVSVYKLLAHLRLV